MTQKFIVLVLSALPWCCAAHSPPVTVNRPWRDVGAIPRLVNEWGFAHGCPIAPDAILTNKHVVTLLMSGRVLLMPPRWSTSDASGVADVESGSKHADLALLRPDRPLTRWFEPAAEVPEIGTEVLIVGYDWSKRGFPPHLVTARVTAIIAGHLTYDNSPAPGSSGSCVLDRSQKVLAVHMGIIHGVGVGAAVWGEWSPLEGR